MTFIIEAPEYTGYSALSLVVFSLIIVGAISAIFIGLALNRPEKISLDGAILSTFILSFLSVIFLIMANVHFSGETFNENTRAEFEKVHSIYIPDVVQLSRGNTYSVVFSTEDGILHEGDMYYNEDNETLTLVENKG